MLDEHDELRRLAEAAHAEEERNALSPQTGDSVSFAARDKLRKSIEGSLVLAVLDRAEQAEAACGEMRSCLKVCKCALQCLDVDELGIDSDGVHDFPIGDQVIEQIDHAVADSAGTEISSRLQRLEKALRPFANNRWMYQITDEPLTVRLAVESSDKVDFTVGDLRRARAALQPREATK